MLHKCKMTILDKKLYPELQEAYCADPQSGPCPCYHVGDQYLFERYDGADDFWKMGAGTLIKATHGIDGVAGGPGPAALLRAVGRGQPLHLHRPAGRQHYARLDEGRAGDDRLLLGRHPPGHRQA